MPDDLTKIELTAIALSFIGLLAARWLWRSFTVLCALVDDEESAEREARRNETDACRGEWHAVVNALDPVSFSRLQELRREQQDCYDEEVLMGSLFTPLAVRVSRN